MATAPSPVGGRAFRAWEGQNEPRSAARVRGITTCGLRRVPDSRCFFCRWHYVFVCMNSVQQQQLVSFFCIPFLHRFNVRATGFDNTRRHGQGITSRPYLRAEQTSAGAGAQTAAAQPRPPSLFPGRTLRLPQLPPLPSLPAFTAVCSCLAGVVVQAGLWTGWNRQTDRNRQTCGRRGHLSVVDVALFCKQNTTPCAYHALPRPSHHAIFSRLIHCLVLNACVCNTTGTNRQH